MQADHTQLLNDSKKNEKAQISQLQSNPGIDFLPRVPQDSKQNGSTDNIAQAESKLIHYFYLTAISRLSLYIRQ